MTDIPNLKFKALLTYPASINGGTGIEATLASGACTINLKYSEFGITGAVPQAAIATTYFLGWQSTNDQYGLVPVTAAGFVSQIPTTFTATPATMGANNISLIFNFAGSVTVTLLGAASNPGRWVYLKTLTANTVISASSNVGALATGTASTAILAATAGRWAILQSDGNIWQIMAAN